MTLTRTVLYSGKGGVGKTTIAAATAVAAAKDGLRTLVISIDTAHSLADIFDQKVGDQPTAIAGTENLWAAQNNTQQIFDDHFATVQNWLRTIFTVPDIADLFLDEFLTPPGSDELVALIEVNRHIQSGKWDFIVVDCAPSGETLRILMLPYMFQRWFKQRSPQRGLSRQALLHTIKKVAKTADINSKTVTALEQISQKVFETTTTIRENTQLSVRLVFTPEHAVLAETRRLLTALTVYGYNVDAVIANRLVPASDHAVLRSWHEQQQTVLQEAVRSFGQLKLFPVNQAMSEVRGTSMLQQLAEELFAGSNPSHLLSQTPGIEFNLKDTSATVAIPFPEPDLHEVILDRRGDDLHLTVDQVTHVLSLPQSFRRYIPKHAERLQTKLVIHFVPTIT